MAAVFAAIHNMQMAVLHCRGRYEPWVPLLQPGNGNLVGNPGTKRAMLGMYAMRNCPRTKAG